MSDAAVISRLDPHGNARSAANQAPGAVPDAPARRPTVFIAHPSELLTDHVANGDGLVAHGFLRELARRGYRLHIAARGLALRESLPPNAVIHPIPIRPGSAWLDRLQAMVKVRRLLARLRRQERIDIVHQMNPVYAGLSLALVGSGLPLVLGTYVARWPRGEVWEEKFSRFGKAMRTAGRWAIGFAQQSQATALLITAPAALNRIAAPRLVRRRLVMMPHGIDIKLFSPAEGSEPEGPSILFYSHLDRRKGVLVLMEAFEIVARAMPSCRLTLTGRGEHIAEVEAHAAASPHRDRIRLLGLVERTVAPALFRSHSVYCLPSFGEPYATTVLEAMACGRPVVTTDAGGMRHLVPEEGGLLVPPGDAPALAEALLRILRDEELQRTMGATNRARVEQRHDWRCVVDELEAVYARIALRT